MQHQRHGLLCKVQLDLRRRFVRLCEGLYPGAQKSGSQRLSKFKAQWGPPPGGHAADDAMACDRRI